jgi:hypothetical protein
VVEKHQLDVPLNVLFSAIFLHSIDHAFTTKAFDPLHLATREHISNEADWAQATIIPRLEPLFTNTHLSASSIPWHQDLFEEMSKVNFELARQLDYCVSY